MELKSELRCFGFTAHDAKSHCNCVHINKYLTVEIHQPMRSLCPENIITSHWDPAKGIIDELYFSASLFWK